MMIIGGGGAGHLSISSSAVEQSVFEGGPISSCMLNDGEVQVGDSAPVVSRVRVDLRGAGGAYAV